MHNGSGAGVTVHGLFEAAARRTPDAVALEQDAVTWTYAEVDAAARAFAATLRDRGAGPGGRVGILLDRSPALVVVMLAVLKAGAAYVPLEPNHPAGRIATLVRDAGVGLVVIEEGTCDRLPDVGCDVVRADDVDPHSENVPDEWASEWADVAYVMYTSGSTGRPKGVVVTHDCVVAFLAGLGQRVALGPGVRMMQFAGVSFDATIGEIFGPLTNGGTVVLPPRGAEGVDPALVTRMAEVTTAFLPPSVLAVLPEADLPGLRELVVGGEVVPADVADRWGRGRRLHVAYGPTETTLIVLTSDQRDGHDAPPIGTPLPGVVAHVLDTDLWPVPPGEVGELYLGGPTVSRGYLDRPGLTADRFVPHPFAEQAGTRLYRTGDLVRELPDGQLAFAGRIDDQAKVRGVRVEPLEVERAVAAQPGVRQCAVVVRGAGAHARLVAFVVGDGLSSAELLRGASAILPAAMVPSLFVPLATLPRHEHGGKVDRAALRELDITSRPGDLPFVEPHDGQERLVCGVWEDVLDVRPVGRDDEFAQLGGSSLQAAVVLTRLRDQLGVALTVRELFGLPVHALAERIASGQPARRTPPPVEVVPDAEVAPSSGQQRLWFLTQFDPAAALAYQVPNGLRVRGELDVAAMRGALSDLVARHEVLRTALSAPAGELTAHLTEPRPVPLNVIDLDGAADPRAEALRQARELARVPFDVAAPPLLRAALFRLGAEDHLLITVLPHVVTDGWSQHVLDRELRLLYAHRTGGPEVPRTPVRYRDYVRWQRDLARDGWFAEDLAHWRDQLTGAPTALTIATDHPHPPVLGYAGERVERAVAADTGDAVAALARRENTTPYTVYLTALAVLLRTLGGQDDLIVASPATGRPGAETADVVGFFAGTLPLRLRPRSTHTFGAVLREARDTVLAAVEHQFVPFESLVAELSTGRDLARTPLAQVALAYQGPLRPEAGLPGLACEPVAVDNGTSKFELTFELDEVANGLRLSVEYRTDLFTPATADRIADRYLRLVRAAVAEPDLPIATLIADAGARPAVLPATAPARAGRCVHELFAEQVARTPDAIAVTDGEHVLSYRELDLAAARLARRLRAAGARPEVLVGLCAERTADLVVAVLAVLKSGAAYVPLDPRYPAERLRFVLADADCALVVGDGAARLPDIAMPFVPIESADYNTTDDTDDNTDEPGPLDGGVRPDNAAYVIHTSGSTGRPKGVVVSHANVSRLFAATAAVHAPGAADTWTLFHSYAFDFSVWEMWGALLHGGRLVVVPYETSRDPDAFWRLLTEQRVTVLSQTPSAFRQLSAVAERLGFPPTALRLVVFGGEALDPRALRPWLRHYGDTEPRLVNMYGITETTVHVTARTVAVADADDDTSAIGRPLADLSLAVVDGTGAPVPVGVPGEVHVGGAGVARGYLGRPALTAERFVPDPLGPPGARRYRTGDLAELREDGELVFLGRNDDQLQFRGFRIEPGEVERALLDSPEVAAAVVVVRTDAAGEQSLVGYAVPAPGAEPRPDRLRAGLAARLPAHLVPSAIVVLAALPLTASGKLDRAALPAPDRPVPVPTGADLNGRSAAQVLAAVWAEVLGVPEVGEHDDFFALGGDSILAVRVVAKATAAGVPLDVQGLFRAPTIAALSRRVTPAEERPAEDWTGWAGERTDVEAVYPASALQTGIIYECEIAEDATLYHDLSTVRVHGPFDEAALRRALAATSARHELLRTGFDLISHDEPAQMVHREAPIPLTVTDAPDGVATWWATQWKTPFHLATAPLVRCAALCHADGSHDLALSVHHSIVDGWSLAVLMSDLLRSYDHELSGGPPPDAMPAVRYRDFVALERATCADPDAERYWQTVIAGARTRLPAATAAETEEPSVHPEVRRELSPERVAAARRLARALSVPLKSVFLGAHLWTLARLTGAADVITGVVSHGRPERTGAELLVGMFVNSLPLRVVTDDDPQALVRAAFAAERDQVRHRRYPVARIRTDTGEPPFEVLFNYADFHAYRALESLRRLRTGEWWYSDRSDFPMLVEVTTVPLTDRRELCIRTAAGVPADLAAMTAELFTESLDRIVGAEVRP